MLDAAERRLGIARDLQIAVNEGGLALHYQPIVNLRDGAVPAVEALVRWDHPVRGRVNAADFISVAEDTGLVVPMGRWVLEEACAQAARWQRELPDRPPTIFINASPREITHPTFLDVVRTAMATAGIGPESIMLEMTEHTLMEERAALEALEPLERMGVGVALDDFGKGHSSLSQLAHFPVRILKLDRAFVSGQAGDADSGPILDAVVRMAGGLGLPVIAEGVETEAQLESVRRRGFDFAQGYLFGRPVAAALLRPVLTRELPFADLLGRGGQFEGTELEATESAPTG
jgi:EAL domain-containing protein (putative c-di-GMP-specific phosphodiesterase class I)